MVYSLQGPRSRIIYKSKVQDFSLRFGIPRRIDLLQLLTTLRGGVPGDAEWSRGAQAVNRTSLPPRGGGGAGSKYNGGLSARSALSTTFRVCAPEGAEWRRGAQAVERTSLTPRGGGAGGKYNGEQIYIMVN